MCVNIHFIINLIYLLIELYFAIKRMAATQEGGFSDDLLS